MPTGVLGGLVLRSLCVYWREGLALGQRKQGSAGLLGGLELGFE